MHDAFEQFGAFSQDAVDNKALLAKGGKIPMPVLAVGAEKSFGTAQADQLRFVAGNVTVGIVPNSAIGSWRRIRRRPSSSSPSFYRNDATRHAMHRLHTPTLAAAGR